MRRFLFAFLIFLAFGAYSQQAEASGDMDAGCSPDWRINNADMSCTNMAIISPGNDTRANLLLLLQDSNNMASKGKYPDLGNERAYGHNFFNWPLLRSAFYPQSDGKGNNDYYGSRCASFDSSSAEFNKAVAANKSISAKDRKLLAEAREFIFDACKFRNYRKDEPNDLIEIVTNAEGFLDQIQLKSQAAKDFLTYLQGANRFYGAHFRSARTDFQSLESSKDRWLRETASYMVARVHLNAAQANSFDKWGTFDGVGSTSAEETIKAEKALTSYIGSYPKGRYTSSAKGLIRRVFWLRQDIARLSQEYQRLLNEGSAANAANLVEEIDNKLLFAEGASGKVSEPLLLATIDLLRMRDDRYALEKTITLVELEKQKGALAGRPDLYNFLLANHAFYIERNPKKVLKLIPDAAQQENFSYLQFSRQALRGTALQMLKDRNEGGFWRDMLGGSKSLYQRPTVELGLAIFYERSGQLEKVFADGSLIRETGVRKILLQKVAGPDSLRKTFKNSARPKDERDFALFTLLYNSLTRGNYAAFLRDEKLIPAKANSNVGFRYLHSQKTIPVGLFGPGATKGEYNCPSLRDTAATLSRAPKNNAARLCLGDFWLENGFDYFYPANPGRYLAVEGKAKLPILGSSKSRFPGTAIPRQRLYKDIISDPRAKAGEKAYALYRAIRCYATSGSNSCGGKGVEKSQRKAWFQRLKRSYPNSKWAKKLKYYW